MKLYCIKYSMFAKNKNTKTELEIDVKIKLYFRCIDSGFKKFETIDEEELSYLLIVLI